MTGGLLLADHEFWAWRLDPLNFMTAVVVKAVGCAAAKSLLRCKLPVQKMANKNRDACKYMDI